MQHLNPLCEYCSRIPLDPRDFESEGTDGEMPIYPLGTNSRIKNSLCPFCCLVVCHFAPEFIGDPCPRNVDLYWGSGPGTRKSLMGDIYRTTRGDTYIGFSSAMQPHGFGPQGKSWYFIEPFTTPVVDTARILRWISSCEQQHASKCAVYTDIGSTRAFRGLRLLRLLDVEANCLVERIDIQRYVALSYVWGTVPTFQLTKANQELLLRPGSLNTISNRLPNTIKDALVLTRHLGCQYLWVDALCLLQDDPDDLEQGVSAMDFIYERSWITVVAACGHNANSRLPGVQEGTRSAAYNTVKVAPGVEMGIVKGLDGLLKSSVYDSRAWTFQERLLSRRVLYFIDNKVFYRCRVAEHAEHFTDDLSQTHVSPPRESLLPRAILMRNPAVDLRAMINHYTRRAMTNQNDAPRAMAGIIMRISEAMKCHFFQCLPTAILDHFIIFHASDKSLSRRSSFPSYSWVGWQGEIDFNSGTVGGNIHTWLMDKTWIIWYMRSPSGNTSPVWDLDANPSFPLSDNRYSGYRSRKAFSHCRSFPRQLDTMRTTPTEKVPFFQPVPSYPILQFWTLSLFYRLSGIDVLKATSYLTDSNGVRCGLIWLDGYEETTIFQSNDSFELILLSESNSNPFRWKTDIEWKDPYPLEKGQWPFYNVFLLVWQGGIAERRGFGVLHQGAVEFSLAPGLSWKEIFLA